MIDIHGNKGGVPAQDGTHLTVRQVDPDDMLLFPETAEGLLAQVSVCLAVVNMLAQKGLF